MTNSFHGPIWIIGGGDNVFFRGGTPPSQFPFFSVQCFPPKKFFEGEPRFEISLPLCDITIHYVLVCYICKSKCLLHDLSSPLSPLSSTEGSPSFSSVMTTMLPMPWNHSMVSLPLICSLDECSLGLKGSGPSVLHMGYHKSLSQCIAARPEDFFFAFLYFMGETITWHRFFLFPL